MLISNILEFYEQDPHRRNGTKIWLCPWNFTIMFTDNLPNTYGVYDNMFPNIFLLFENFDILLISPMREYPRCLIIVV